jgi:hypothetical protein
MNQPTEAPRASVRDAYLQWAIATQFRFVRSSRFGPFNDRSIGLLIEWLSPAHAKRGDEAARQAKIHVPGVYSGSRSFGGVPRIVWTLSVPLTLLPDFLGQIESLARRIELAAALAPAPEQVGVGSIGPLNKKLLAAVLDDGCAFANTRFMIGVHPRVLWLWNQEASAIAGAPLVGANGPSIDSDFMYGRQWARPQLQALTKLPGGQAQAYAEAELSSLRRAAAHGPHITDLLCGRETWDLVFVQFPRAGIDDPSGLWLKRHAIEGLNYVLECAGPATTTVVANLSWGPQTGPHDGNSVLEHAIDEMVALQKAQGRELIVSVPAGNSFASQAHAQIPFGAGGSVRWVVPPDGRTPAFLEVWWPRSVALADVRMRVRPPSGPAVDLVPGMNPPSLLRWAALLLPTLDSGPMALLVVHPTEFGDASLRGLHGTWTLEFDRPSCGAAGDIHVYVARADHNMGARRRARANYLTDDPYEAHRFVTASQRDDEATGSAVRRAGTLNGLASGAATNVAAGYRFSDFRMARYSSSGRSRGTRAGPDFSCVTDQSPLVLGVRAAGVRSGTVVRLVGTSTAAPQLGRILANDSGIPFDPLPPVSPDRKGFAYLWPEDGVVSKK